MKSWGIVLAVLALGLAWLIYGLLTMTDPSTGPHPEPSPALVGSGEVPETSPVQP
jgi:hypothetical protein